MSIQVIKLYNSLTISLKYVTIYAVSYFNFCEGESIK